MEEKKVRYPQPLTTVQAWKKIEETKKKAKEIMTVRQRNAEIAKQKESRMIEKQNEERMLQERNLNMRMQRKEEIQMKLEQTVGKKREQANQIKMEN